MATALGVRHADAQLTPELTVLNTSPLPHSTEASSNVAA